MGKKDPEYKASTILYKKIKALLLTLTLTEPIIYV